MEEIPLEVCVKCPHYDLKILDWILGGFTAEFSKCMYKSKKSWGKRSAYTSAPFAKRVATSTLYPCAQRELIEHSEKDDNE